MAFSQILSFMSLEKFLWVMKLLFDPFVFVSCKTLDYFCVAYVIRDGGGYSLRLSSSSHLSNSFKILFLY